MAEYTLEEAWDIWEKNKDKPYYFSNQACMGGWCPFLVSSDACETCEQPLYPWCPCDREDAEDYEKWVHDPFVW